MRNIQTASAQNLGELLACRWLGTMFLAYQKTREWASQPSGPSVHSGFFSPDRFLTSHAHSLHVLATSQT